MEKQSAELIIKNAKIVFAELEDKGFGKNIVIDVTDKELQDLITDFYKAEKIGSGKPKFKDYTNKDGKTTKQFTIKLSEYTDIEGKDGLDAKDLRFGAVVNILVRTYAWNNTFGEGISARAQSIFLLEGGAKTNMAKIAE
jgi:hypothetical protein